MPSLHVFLIKSLMSVVYGNVQSFDVAIFTNGGKGNYGEPLNSVKMVIENVS